MSDADCTPAMNHRSVAASLFYCLFFCTVTDFSAAEKGRGVKFACVFGRIAALSGQVFSHFGELWLAWSHGGGITSGMICMEIAVGQSELGAVAWWAFGTEARHSVRPYGGICVLQAC